MNQEELNVLLQEHQKILESGSISFAGFAYEHPTLDFSLYNLKGIGVNPGVRVLGNVLITEYSTKNSYWWRIKSWVVLEENSLAKALFA